MAIDQLITPQRISCLDAVSSKKRALEALAALMVADSDRLTEAEVFDCLITRERLGSTGLGQGVAIPHGRMALLPAPVGAFLRLREPADYDAVDQRPVDLLFALLVPEEADETHLQILADLARRFSDPDLCAALRDSDDAVVLHRLLVEGEATPAA